MAKQLTFTYKDKEYVLEYNRKIVQTMESNGFSIQDIDRKPTIVLPTLFAGAFRMHCQGTKQSTIDEILSHITDKEGLFVRLAEMYNDPAAEVMAEPEEGAEGNVSWTANW